jgi:polyisoprenoid-binding protein YceI
MGWFSIYFAFDVVVGTESLVATMQHIDRWVEMLRGERRRLLCLTSAAATMLAAPTLAAENYSIDSTHTIPGFEVKHFGVTTQRGRFDRAKGCVTLDVAARRGSVALTIDARSLDIGSSAANRLLMSQAMLDVDRFPVITFQSDRLVFDGDQVVGAEGTLTLVGVSKPITVAVSGFSCGRHPLVKRPMCGGDISATLRRSEFGLTKFLPDIGDFVRIDVPVETFGVSPTSLPDTAQSCPQANELRPTKAADGEPSGRDASATPSAIAVSGASPGLSGLLSPF